MTTLQQRLDKLRASTEAKRKPVKSAVKAKTKTRTPKAKPAPKPKPGTNYVAFLLDRSSAIGPVFEDMIEALNKAIREVQRQSAAIEQKTHISIYTYADTVFCEARLRDVAKFKEFTQGDIEVYGGLALFDALWQVHNDFDSIALKPETSFLVNVISSGRDAHSQLHMPIETVRWLRDEVPAAGSIWTVSFCIPDVHLRHFSRDLHIPTGDLLPYTMDDAGVTLVSDRLTTGIARFFAKRAEGVARVSSFFKLAKPKETESTESDESAAVFRTDEFGDVVQDEFYESDF